MSIAGKLSRGLKWWKYNRDLDGNLKINISDDVDKMIEINYYLNYVKDKDRDAIDLALYKLYLLRHAPGGVRSKLFIDLLEKIKSGDFPVKEIKSKGKK